MYTLRVDSISLSSKIRKKEEKEYSLKVRLNKKLFNKSTKLVIQSNICHRIFKSVNKGVKIKF